MNLRQIETFAAVMKCGTASRAAEVLGVTQPAVSRSIAECERSVGFALFARVRNRLVATPEARLLYEEVQSAFVGLDAIRAAAARIRDRGSGEIRVASMFAISQTIVARGVALFRARHPYAHTTLHVLPSRDVRDRIASGQCDVGFAGDLVDTTGLVHETFITRDALCVVPMGHRLALKDIVEPLDLDGEPFISYLPEDRFRQRLEAVLDAAGSKPNIVLETAYAPVALGLVSHGVGVTLASPHAIGSVDRSMIVAKPFRPAVHVRVLLLLPSDRPKSQLVRDFIGAMIEAR